MSLPADVQVEIVHAMRGLEEARMLRPAYAVEYDFIQPTELTSVLETKRSRVCSRRENQRHVGIRRGGSAGTDSRSQRRLAGVQIGHVHGPKGTRDI